MQPRTNMLKSKFDFIFLGLLAFFFVFILFRSNNYYRKLSGTKGRITIGHVYEKDTGSRGSIYYKYIFKVGNDYYSSQTSGSNVKDLHAFIPQYFLVAYYKPDPTIHTVLWSYRLDTFVPLGASLDTLPFDRSLIKKHTVGWNGLSPSADINDSKAMTEYESKTGKKL